MTIINGARQSGAIRNGARSLSASGGGSVPDGGGGSEETLVMRMPASTDLSADQWAAYDGVGQNSTYGTWWRMGANDYAYLLKSDGTEQVGVDPGESEASLAGLAGIAIPTDAGSRTSAENGEHARAAIAAARPEWTVSLDGDLLSVTGEFEADDDASAVGGTYASRGTGTGVYGTRATASGSSFAVDDMRMMLLDAAELPASAGRVIGMRYLSGAAAAGSAVRLGLGSGGAPGVTAGVDIVAQKRCVSSGPRLWHDVYFAPEDVFYSDDLSSESLWAVIAGDNDAGAISAENVGNGHSQQWVGASVLYITGQSAGSATPFPDTAIASIGGNAFGIFIQLIVQVAPYYGNGRYLANAGPVPGETDTFGSTSNINNIHVGWIYDFPVGPELVVYEVGVHLATHGAGQQVRLEMRNGIVAEQDPGGEALHFDIGATSGTETGWNVLAEPEGVGMLGGSYRFSLRSNGSAPPGDTQLSFNAGPHDQDGTPEQWRWWRGESSEVEYTAANGETALNFDPSVAPNPVLAPNSPVLTPGNSGGLYVQFGHRGVELSIPE